MERVRQFIEKAVPHGTEAVITIPDVEAHGHYTTSVALRLAKELKRPPMEVAEEIATKIRAGDSEKFFERVEAALPGFVNMWIAPKVIQDSLKEIVKAGQKWGKPRKTPFTWSRGKQKKTVVIDYSHPNIAKPMGVHHLRSTIIGDALYRIFTFSGWNTISDNHLGDWGKQFGVLITAWKELLEKPHNISIDFLMQLYVDYSARMKTDEALHKRAREEVKKLQNGDRENVKLWKEFYRVSLAEFNNVYKLLGIRFDYFLSESFYNTMLAGIVEDALKKGVAIQSEGAIIIPIEGKAPFVIQKSDEAFLYSTTDLAAIIYRNKKFKPDLALYVVDNGQSLHFEQLFEAAKKLGYTRGETLAHVKFGLILGEDLKKLSTRGGKHIKLDEVIEEAIEKARAIVQEKRIDLSEAEKSKVANAVGIGSLKYNDLSQNRQSDIAFRWEKMLNLEGNSAPYLMYTHARLKSILRKMKVSRSFDASMLTGAHELRLIRMLLQFPVVIEQITKNYFPHYLTDYCYALAGEANAFYHSSPILQSEPKLQKARLALVVAVTETLHTGLNLLGIEAPEKM